MATFRARLPRKEATMTSENTEPDCQPVAKTGKPDWVSIGSLVVIAISLLGMAFIFWTRYELER